MKNYWKLSSKQKSQNMKDGKQMKKLMALALIFTLLALVVDSGQKDLVALNHWEVVLMAIGLTVLGTVLMVVPLMVWERRLNK